MKTILAPIDFSPVSRQVVAEAVALARPLQARVVLLHSVPPPPIIATDLAPLAGTVFTLTDSVQKAAARHLRRIQRALAQRDVTVETVCTDGFPATQILERATALGANYVVIGSHGHGAFHDLLVGSTASGVLKGAPCPVVVVPARKKQKKRRARKS